MLPSRRGEVAHDAPYVVALNVIVVIFIGKNNGATYCSFLPFRIVLSDASISGFYPGSSHTMSWTWMPFVEAEIPSEHLLFSEFQSVGSTITPAYHVHMILGVGVRTGEVHKKY